MLGNHPIRVSVSHAVFVILNENGWRPVSSMALGSVFFRKDRVLGAEMLGNIGYVLLDC